MYKIKVVLDTRSDIIDFVNIANTYDIDTHIYLEDGTGFRADAKSLMGVMYGKVEFANLYVVSDDDTISSKFMKFIA